MARDRSERRRRRPVKKPSIALPLALVGGVLLLGAGAFFALGNQPKREGDSPSTKEAKRPKGKKTKPSKNNEERPSIVNPAPQAKSKTNPKSAAKKERRELPKKVIIRVPDLNDVAEKLMEIELRKIAAKNAAAGRTLSEKQLRDLKKWLVKPTRREAAVYVSIYRIGKELGASQKLIDDTIARFTQLAKHSTSLPIGSHDDSIRAHMERMIDAEKKVDKALRGN
ncbi:MAG: hypothetical protein P1V97_23500 [Planctomycetota bacterium]|nr:hypothetical protein [Planctomycetota bacterium]